MSRVGRMPINVPGGVTVKVKPGNEVIVSGPRGKLTRTFHPDMSIKVEDEVITISRSSDHRLQRMQHGLTRALLNNMVVGVTDGYKKDMEIVGTGYRAEMKGPTIILHMGYSNPVEMEAPKGISYKLAERSNRNFSIEGIDKELVGLTAARVRAVRPPEPYHGKGIRYAGEYVRRKQGKTGK
ncbi:MAG: 50S ribosomal protein L6 [Chloroflexota bacterium]|nr:50S ribosomal protein L6 [Chloroflexota bacterium]